MLSAVSSKTIHLVANSNTLDDFGSIEELFNAFDAFDDSMDETHIENLVWFLNSDDQGPAISNSNTKKTSQLYNDYDPYARLPSTSMAFSVAGRRRAFSTDSHLHQRSTAPTATFTNINQTIQPRIQRRPSTSVASNLATIFKDEASTGMLNCGTLPHTILRWSHYFFLLLNSR